MSILAGEIILRRYYSGPETDNISIEVDVRDLSTIEAVGLLEMAKQQYVSKKADEAE